MVKVEPDIVKECKDRLDVQSSSYGIVMDIFEFVYDKVSNRHKGHLFQITSEDRISFEHAQGSQKACVKLSGSSKPVDAVFMTFEHAMKPKLEEMVDRGFKLRNDTILKALLCAENVVLSKMVIAFANFDQTLPEYLVGLKYKIATGAMKRGDYLSGQEQNLISSGWMALDDIWGKGYTSDDLNQLDSYVMVGEKMKILPFVIRLRRPDEADIMVLKTQFVDLLKNHFAPIWKDPEVDQLIDLMKNPLASTRHVLGHPVLSSPLRRQILYRTMGCTTNLSSAQLAILSQVVQVDANWQKTAEEIDPVLKIMINEGLGYEHDVIGALRFGRTVSAHYVQRLRAVNKGLLPGWFTLDTIDKLLKCCIAGVLCGRYALEHNARFMKKTI